ncbi:helix-turn-helix domain-containing protein [Microbacteriaceae bacterium VKM Ac-2855]|nr:helix-turn-helix domain-containing protein [Microbacteriaceae bacterium VKM Ac-2855]
MATDLLLLGKRIRHYRSAAGLTLDQMGEKVGTVGSLLSLIENGKREPKLSLLQAVAEVLGVTAADLLSGEAPDRRAELEIEVERLQRGASYTALGLPRVRSTKALPTEALESIVGLHRELERRTLAATSTPEEAKRANTELRMRMRGEDNYMDDLETIAEQMLAESGHVSGPLTHRTVARMAEGLGFELVHVPDLPHSTRTVTDLENGRIYLPPASIPGGHGLRSLALQAIAHRILAHRRPASYAEFLLQRLEINYFAAACLMPRLPAVEYLAAAKKERNLAIEDFRDAFGVTHEAAAHRFTNLATSHLGLRTHFLRVGGDGTLFRGFENDGLPLATDANGSIEGQIVCREWAARNAFERTSRTSEFYQYTDTPVGTFWCTTQTGTTATEEFSISVGVPFDDARWFRGRDTTARAVSTCPAESCCRRPDERLSARWAQKSWPSARMHAHVLSPLPQGSFPGVDDAEVYAFLESHARV